MTTTQNLQIRLRQTPDGIPREQNFEATPSPIPQPGQGELLCRNLWLSLDPYMRSQIAGRHISGLINEGDLMMGETVAEVVQTQHPDYSVGQLVRGFGNWQQYSLLHGDHVSALPAQLTDTPELALSGLGMPGLTAWAGLTQLTAIKAGDILLLPAATGAVGCVAAGIARHRGARVIAVVGSEDKRRYALQTLHCADAIDRNNKDETVAQALDRICADGVDVYFDLVGGELLHLAAERLRLGANIILCGLMAEYNSPERSAGPAPGLLLRARARMSALVVYDYEALRNQFISECLPLVKSGEIQVREDITEGLVNAPEAFCRLMRGENFGKVLIRV